MKKLGCIFAILFVMILFARPAAAAPRLNLIAAGSVTDSAPNSLAALWNPASIAFNEKTLAFSITGATGFFAFHRALYSILNNESTPEDILLVISEDPAAGYFLSYADRWFGCTVSLYGECMRNTYAAVAVTLSGSYQFEDLAVLGDVAFGCNLHLFRGAGIDSWYDGDAGLMTTNIIRGNGIALDLGMIAKMTDRFHFGLVVRDVVYGFWGTRTYRAVDENGNLLVENSQEYSFERDNHQDYMLFGDSLDPLNPPRTTVDLGIAMLLTETTRLTADVQGINFGIDDLWNVANCQSVNLGLEQDIGSFTVSLDFGLEDNHDLLIAAGTSYCNDNLSVQMLLRYSTLVSFQFEAGLAWRFQ